MNDPKGATGCWLIPKQAKPPAPLVPHSPLPARIGGLLVARFYCYWAGAHAMSLSARSKNLATQIFGSLKLSIFPATEICPEDGSIAPNAPSAACVNRRLELLRRFRQDWNVTWERPGIPMLLVLAIVRLIAPHHVVERRFYLLVLVGDCIDV